MLGDLATGFQNEPVKIIATIAVVIFLLAFFITTLVVINRREKRRLAETIKQKNDRAFARLKLNDAEITLVKRLSRFLKDPSKEYLVVSSQRTFAACLHGLRELEEVAKDTLLSIQGKTGFKPFTANRQLQSSRDLPEGMPVVVESNKHRTAGTIEGQSDKFFVVRLTDILSAEPMATVRLFCHHPRGVYDLSAKLLSVADKNIKLEHSSSLRSVQRRKYYRRKMKTAVYLKREESQERAVQAMLLDLGGGGASLENPEKKFIKGDDIRIYFHQGGKNWLPIEASVVRTSRRGGVLHLQFGHVNEATRDRIIKMVNKG